MECIVAGLNEHHKRRLLSTFEHANELLNRCLDAVNPGPGHYSRYVQDMSDSDIRWIESYLEKIRDQLHDLLLRFEVEIPKPSIASSWVIKTGLISLDIALEDLSPHKLKGYGSVDTVTAKELTWALQEIRRLLNQMFAFLEDAGSERERQILQLEADFGKHGEVSSGD